MRISGRGREEKGGKMKGADGRERDENREGRTR